MPRRKTHGGKRDGAGRPPLDKPKSVMFTLRLTEEQSEWLERTATDLGHTAREYVTKWLLGVGMPPRPK